MKVEHPGRKTPTTLEEALVYIAELEVALKNSLEMNKALEARLARLEEQSKKDSTNSSKPPSSDSPFKRPPATPPTGLKPGGQPGHKGHHRSKQEATDIEIINPLTCQNCRTALQDGSATGEERVTQQTDVEIRKVVREVRMQQHCCAECGEMTWGQMPAAMTDLAFAPGLEAPVTAMTVQFGSEPLERGGVLPRRIGNRNLGGKRTSHL